MPTVFSVQGDVAQELFSVMLHLDRFAFVVTPATKRRPVLGLTPAEYQDFRIWRLVETSVKTEVMVTSFADDGQYEWKAGGTLEPGATYLDVAYAFAEKELLGMNRRIVQARSTSPKPTHRPTGR